MISRTSALALVAGAALALPTAATAATKTVNMGLPPAGQKAMGEVSPVAEAVAFFPSSTTIRVGDSVRFVPFGFHDVYIPKKGHSANVPFFVPTGAKVAGANDAAGNPFWFNGIDNLAVNPKVLMGSMGKKVTYTGAEAVESGAPLGPKPKPMTVRFTKAGTVTYLCNIHPGMKGRVKVLPKSRKAPSAKQDAAALTKEIGGAVTTATSLAATPIPANTVVLGVAGKGGVELFDFFPKATTVPVGTTVTFTMDKDSFEAHTATAGPGNPESQPDSYLGKLASSTESPDGAAQLLYPSDLPTGPASLTPTLHGNGFWNSGALDSNETSMPPSSSQVTFASAGTYTFYCLIHPFMSGTVTAQ